MFINVSVSGQTKADTLEQLRKQEADNELMPQGDAAISNAVAAILANQGDDDPRPVSVTIFGQRDLGGFGSTSITVHNG